MANKNMKIGVVTKKEVFYFYDYFEKDDYGNRHAISVTNHRGQNYTARMIDDDGDDWFILKLLFENRYKRIKKKSIRSFEIKKIHD